MLYKGVRPLPPNHSPDDEWEDSQKRGSRRANITDRSLMLYSIHEDETLATSKPTTNYEKACIKLGIHERGAPCNLPSYRHCLLKDRVQLYQEKGHARYLQCQCVHFPQGLLPAQRVCPTCRHFFLHLKKKNII